MADIYIQSPWCRDMAQTCEIYARYAHMQRYGWATNVLQTASADTQRVPDTQGVSDTEHGVGVEPTKVQRQRVQQLPTIRPPHLCAGTNQRESSVGHKPDRDRQLIVQQPESTVEWESDDHWVHSINLCTSYLPEANVWCVCMCVCLYYSVFFTHFKTSR